MTLKEMRDRRDDAQSQLDALCGECPDVAAELVEEIEALSRGIAETIAATDDDGYPGPCSDPDGHEWPRVEETERCLCIHCGADGDA